MTIWGKFRNLFAPKCQACRTPLKPGQKIACSAKCSNLMAELQGFSI